MTKLLGKIIFSLFFAFILFLLVFRSAKTQVSAAITCLPAGNIDCDQTVSLADFIYLSIRYAENDLSADLNNDAKVNALDLALLMANFGKSQTVTPTPAPISLPPAAPSTNPAIPFYLGLYEMTDTGQLANLFTVGFSNVSISPDTVASSKTYLDAAAAAGLKVRLSLSPSFLDMEETQVANYIKQLASHPAVSLWSMPEEPETDADHQRWLRLYQILKNADPNHPAAIYLAGSTLQTFFQKWADVTDIFLVGSYPEYYNIPRATIFTKVKNASIVAKQMGKKVIGTPQFFDLDTMLKMEGTTQVPAGLYRGHPTAFEMRADAYAAIIAGAEGLDWYTYQYGYQIPESWEGLKAVVSQLRNLSPVLTQGTAGPTVNVTILSGPLTTASYSSLVENSIQTRSFIYGSEIYLLTVNLSDQPVSARFSGLSTASSQTEVKYENRSLSVNSGSFADNFVANDVHVYRLNQ